MAASLYWTPYQRHVHRALRLEGTWFLSIARRFVTFHLVCLAWVFFRAPSVGDAFDVVRGVFSQPALPVFVVGTFGRSTLAVLLVAFLLHGFFAWFLRGDGSCRLLARPTAGRWAMYLAIAYSVLLLHVETDAFIYLGSR